MAAHQAICTRNANSTEKLVERIAGQRGQIPGQEVVSPKIAAWKQHVTHVLLGSLVLEPEWAAICVGGCRVANGGRLERGSRRGEQLNPQATSAVARHDSFAWRSSPQPPVLLPIVSLRIPQNPS